MEKTLNLKNNLEKIEIDYFTANLPDLKNISESKAVVIGKWLSKAIDDGFKAQEIKNGQLLPTKAEFAYRLGVSIGTVQNALKYCSDCGCIDAKPCMGTVAKDKNSPKIFNQKVYSKRDAVIVEVKNYIKTEKFREGDNISTPQNIAKIINRPVNTVRQAFENLCTQGILKHIYRNSSGKTGWYLISGNFDKETQLPEMQTLVEKTVSELKEYITKHYKKGEKIYSHAEFSQILNVSMSTIHAAFKVLCDEGILRARRGQYGTTVLRMPDEKISVRPEMSIFAPALEAQEYYYQKIQSQIKKIISKDYEIGDKLPPITTLAQMLEISPNTVRKALVKITEEGYVKSLRGRYGGTVVTDIPEEEGQSFRWLAVNPKYALKK